MSNSPRFFSAVRFTKQSGSNSSTHGRRGRTNTDGRGCRELLNMHFFTLESRKGMRGCLDTFAMIFFTFKSKRVGEQLAWLFFTFKNSNSSSTGALARAGM